MISWDFLFDNQIPFSFAQIKSVLAAVAAVSVAAVPVAAAPVAFPILAFPFPFNDVLLCNAPY